MPTAYTALHGHAFCREADAFLAGMSTQSIGHATYYLFLEVIFEAIR